MKLLALLTPCAMLAVLWVLQRLEVWVSDPAAQGARATPRSIVRPRATAGRLRAEGSRRG